MEGFKLRYRVHALQRMFGRNINEKDILNVLLNGHIIQDYPDDTPYPSKPISGTVGNRPIHVLFAENFENNEKIIITVYEPDPLKWNENFLRRKIQ
jgi:hypothetical protein